MFSWNWDPLILLGLGLQAGAYLACVGPLRSRFPGAEPVPPARVQTFLLGSLVLLIALCSPIETLGDGYLLSAHMIQHLLMTLIAPPLLLLGTPRWLFRPLLRVPLALPLGRLITNPIFGLLSFNMVFALWHTPAYYEATLRSTPIHVLEHALFLITATLTWWPVFSPMDELPRIPEPAQCLYLFVESLPPTILGALITFSGAILYPTYGRAPRVWGISPQLDQQMAGLIMWVPGALVFLGVLTVVFFRWFNNDEYTPSQDAQPAAR